MTKEEKLIHEANEYLETHDANTANTRHLEQMIDNINDALDNLRSFEPDSPQIDELEDCLNNLEYLKGCAEEAVDKGLSIYDIARATDQSDD